MVQQCLCVLSPTEEAVVYLGALRRARYLGFAARRVSCSAMALRGPYQRWLEHERDIASASKMLHRQEHSGPHGRKLRDFTHEPPWRVAWFCIQHGSRESMLALEATLLRVAPELSNTAGRGKKSQKKRLDKPLGPNTQECWAEERGGLLDRRFRTSHTKVVRNHRR